MRELDGENLLDQLLTSILVNEETSRWIEENIASISPRWLRFLASYYPDARIRRECMIQSGVRIGADTYPNYGIYVIDRYNQEPREDLLTIGARVSIGPRVTFVCESSPNASRLLRCEDVRRTMIKKGGIVIGDDVWIGAGATILPDVQIGNMSVVGAHTLVRENVPPYAVVAGTPARVVRRIERPEKHTNDDCD